MASPLAKSIDQAACWHQDLPDFFLDPSLLARLKADNFLGATDKFWIAIQASVFDHVRAGPLWSAITDPKTKIAAQAIFDEVNLSRVKQVYAETCIAHVTEHRILVRNLRKLLPDVAGK
jgi:hypothetical protein